MSANEEAQEIIKLVNQLEIIKERNKRNSILKEISAANKRIKSEFVKTKESSLYENLIKEKPPEGKKKQFTRNKTSIIAPPIPIKVQKKKALEPVKSVGRFSKKEKQQLMTQLDIDEDDLKNIYKKKKRKKHAKDEDYEFTVYVPSKLGIISNRLFSGLVDSTQRNHPNFYKILSDSVKVSGMTMLSKTYVAIMFFASLTAAIAISLMVATFTFLSGMTPLLMVISTFFGFFGGGILSFFLMYAYPTSEASRKSRKINQEIPFAVIHMAAVAGSGAKPISMFKLLLNSGEYKGIESEIKKIVNFVNLFGYDMSTALKNVSKRTPSTKFRDLLTGISSTIESGGSLKSYLESTAKDSMATYRLERKKHVESLSTYSDIYTGLLIAAPLLFMLALTIINLMSDSVGGMKISTIAMGGTYLVLPIINIMFYLFLNMVQPSE